MATSSRCPPLNHQDGIGLSPRPPCRSSFISSWSWRSSPSISASGRVGRRLPMWSISISLLVWPVRKNRPPQLRLRPPHPPRFRQLPHHPSRDSYQRPSPPCRHPLPLPIPHRTPRRDRRSLPPRRSRRLNGPARRSPGARQWSRQIAATHLVPPPKHRERSRPHPLDHQPTGRSLPCLRPRVDRAGKMRQRTPGTGSASRRIITAQAKAARSTIAT